MHLIADNGVVRNATTEEIIEIDARRAEYRMGSIEKITKESDRIAKAKRDAATAQFSSAEMAGWPIKRSEAVAYHASGDPLTAPNLSAEAQYRGVALSVIVEKVLSKAAFLCALEAGIAGRCGALQDAAKAAATQAELDAIYASVNMGWPV